MSFEKYIAIQPVLLLAGLDRIPGPCPTGLSLRVGVLYPPYWWLGMPHEPSVTPCAHYLTGRCNYAREGVVCALRLYS